MILQIGVKVIIKNSDGLILLLRRADHYLTNGLEAWDIPGGRIKPEEALMDALAREVEEELGVELIGSPTLLIAQDIFVSHKDLHVVRLTYLHTMDVANVTLSEEHYEYRWVALDETKNFSIEPFLREALDSLTTK